MLPRVLMVIHQFRPIACGAEMQVERLAGKLVMLGHQVQVLTQRRDPRPLPFEIISGISVHRVDFPLSHWPYRDIGKAVQVFNYLYLFHEFQIIITNDFLSYPYSGCWDLLSGCIPSLGWTDAATPPLDKRRTAAALLLYYYAPRIGIPLAMVVGLFAGIGVIVCSVKQKQVNA